MAKIVVTFKLEDGIYSKLKEIAEKEGRGISEIMRESLTDWLQNNKHVSTPDFITFIKEQKNLGKSWSEISSLVASAGRLIVLLIALSTCF